MSDYQSDLSSLQLWSPKRRGLVLSEEEHMKKRIFSILSVMLVASMIVSPVSAGPNIRLSGGTNNVEWDLGSLIAQGALIVGDTDVIVNLQASGRPEVTCTNQGSNPSPGQNPPNISGTGAQVLLEQTRNGRAPFDVEAVPPETLPGSLGGCPNDKWTAHIDFVYWDYAKITVFGLDGSVLLEVTYTCETTRNPDTVSCRSN
jgi:hypothetical protein